MCQPPAMTDLAHDVSVGHIETIFLQLLCTGQCGGTTERGDQLTQRLWANVRLFLVHLLLLPGLCTALVTQT